MSIRPFEGSLPTSQPPPASVRPANESPAAPIASPQSGASAVSTVGLSPASPSGTITASAQQARNASGIGPNTAGPTTDQKELAAAIEQVREAVNTQVRDFSFSIHEKTGEIVVRIVDRESKEVIRQIPAEEMLRLAEHLKTLEGENKPGLLIKQEV